MSPSAGAWMGFDRDKFTISDQGELTFHSDYEVDYDRGQQTFLVRVVAFDGESTHQTTS